MHMAAYTKLLLLGLHFRPQDSCVYSSSSVPTSAAINVHWCTVHSWQFLPSVVTYASFIPVFFMSSPQVLHTQSVSGSHLDGTAT